MTNPTGLDLEALSTWLSTAAPGLLDPAATLTGEVIAGGKSNLTYTVTDGTTRVIVRRPPLGHVLATAHDMGREHRVMAALATTPVPVPRMYAACPDDTVIGAPFYVMELVEGTPYRTASQLEALGAERTRRISERMVDTLADLHVVDPASVDLGDFGRPEGLPDLPGSNRVSFGGFLLPTLYLSSSGWGGSLFWFFLPSLDIFFSSCCV